MLFEINIRLIQVMVIAPIAVAARSRAWVYGRSFAAIVGSNPTGGMDVCVVFVVRTVAWTTSDMKYGRI
jgi:hypothetical protein